MSLALTIVAGPFKGDGRGGPLPLFGFGAYLGHAIDKIKVDGFQLDADWDDFGEQFEVYKFTATPELIQTILDEAQKELDELNGEDYVDEDGNTQIYDKHIEIENEEDAVFEYLTKTNETLETLLIHPVRWLREAAVEVMKQKNNDA